MLKRATDTELQNPSTEYKLHSLLLVDNKETGNIKTITKLLIAHGADVNAVDDSGDSALHLWALSPSNLLKHRLAETLLNSGANPNLLNHAGQSPLDLATSGGNAQIISLLQLPGYHAKDLSSSQKS